MKSSYKGIVLAGGLAHDFIQLQRRIQAVITCL